jgi:hypothetical protein
MFRLLDKHQGFIRSVLWPVSLISAALFVPFVIAKTIPSRLGVRPSSSPSQPSLIQTPEKLATERQWQHNLVSQGLSYKPTPENTTNKTADKSTTAKTDTSQTKSTTTKTDTTQTKSSATKTHNSQPSKPKNQTQASPPPKASKTQNTNKAPAQPPQPSKNAPALELRVAVANGESSLVVGSSTSTEIVSSQGKVLGKISANEGTNVLPDGQYLRIGKWIAPAGVWLKPAKGGFVFVNNNWYRGDVLLVSQGNSLLAVNYVELEYYIASVVGAEVSPSWPIDALKAQAIAARSYALVHYIRPAHDLYDLGNTERWQVYRGVGAEWNTTHQAAQETHGVFLSYKGGVVESMYAASDDIVKDVFGGRGMSQTGALKLAEQGYNYTQILGSYYPGTSLAWMDTKVSDVD